MLLRVSPPAEFACFLSLRFPCSPRVRSALPRLLASFQECKLPMTSVNPGKKGEPGPLCVCVLGGPRFAPLSLLSCGTVAPRMPLASSTPPLDAQRWRCGQLKLLQPGEPGTVLPATRRPPVCASACVLRVCNTVTYSGICPTVRKKASLDPPSTPLSPPPMQTKSLAKTQPPPPHKHSFPPHNP